MFQPDPRYFSGTMIPLTIMIARIFSTSGALLGGHAKKAYIILLLWSTVFNYHANIQHVFWLRQMIGQRSHRFFYAAKTIYEDIFPDKKDDVRGVAFYYCTDYCYQQIGKPMKFPRLAEATYYVELGYNAWNKTESPSIEEFERLAQELGTKYYVTHEEGLSEKSERVKLLRALSGVNTSSFLERMLYAIKQKKPGTVYIYKYTGF